MHDVSARREFRCAIYTRKSSEEGLEQDFNSLHAQREACEAYIKSQKHEGWKGLSAHYDDGGYSGGSMERPALRRLLADIAAKRIDIVVVYKVDRLTRSLADFAKIVEVFDASGVSFVSVTQAFNTTTSMGRLTLNVLLSFAQFEREVTGERIRDKVAASKKKGLWMGGFVPIGYEAKDRTLAVNAAEAETVRTIFRLYLECGSVDALKQELDRLGIVTKLRSGRSARMSGGHPFSRGHLYRVLSNPLYRGQIRHKGQIHPGQHPAIIDEEIWVAVQASLAQNNHRQRVKTHSKNPSLLAGLLVDAAGEKLVATHATKQGRRYRYYVTAAALRKQHRSDADSKRGPALRLPAAEIESAVIRLLTDALRDRSWLLDTVAPAVGGVEGWEKMTVRADQLRRILDSDDAIGRRGLLLDLVQRVVVQDRSIEIALRAAALGSAPLPARQEPSDEPIVRLCRELVLAQRGPETRLIIAGEGARAPEPDPALIKALAQAHRWWGDLLHGRYGTMRDLARAYDTDERYAARIIPLAFVPADLTRAILDGRQPPALTLHSFLYARAAPRQAPG